MATVSDAAPSPAATAMAVLAAAARLARRGRYAAAEQVLDLLDDGDGTPLAVLDLRARIAAQDGRVDEAAALWRRVLVRRPDDVGARAAVARLDALRRRPLRRFVPGAGFAAAVLALALVLVLAGAARHLARLDARLPPPAAGPPPATAGPGSVPAPAAVEPAAPALPPFELPEVSLRSEGGAWVAVFEQPLFERGTDLRPSGRRLLTELARRLAPRAGQLAIEVRGHTDHLVPWPSSGFEDNPALALARAVVVAEHLRRTGGLPAHRLSARAVAGSAPAGSETGLDHARTASLRITAAPPG